VKINSLLGKLLKRPVLDSRTGHSILSGRGNLDAAYPSDFSDEEKELIDGIREFTMTSSERMATLARAVDYIVHHDLRGDIVECGVWKGGSMMLVAQKLKRYNDTNRNLYLFDTFEGMSEPTDKDVSGVDNNTAKDLLGQADRLSGDNVWCYSPLDDVRSNLYKTGYPNDKLIFVKGKVEDTLPYPGMGPIALLRLDTDWYESTRHELHHLYDLIVPGGILIIDDYGHWSGSRKAVDEFIKERNLRIFLNRIDYTGRLAVKP